MIPIVIQPKKVIEPNYSQILNKISSESTTTQNPKPNKILEQLETQKPFTHPIYEEPAKTENPYPNFWENMIEKYPELASHGVTADLLETMYRMNSDLPEKIEEYFTSNKNFQKNNEDRITEESDSRKGLIEHFFDSNFNRNRSEDILVPWDDPNHNTWSEFTQCSQNCGIGIKMRQRTCDYPVCQNPGIETEIEPCFVHSCDEIGSGYSLNVWSPFTACSKQCGVGHSMRFRMCDGIICPIPGYQTQTITCYMPKCPGKY